MSQIILNKRHNYTFQVITELPESVAVNNLTSEDKSPNHVKVVKTPILMTIALNLKAVYNLNVLIFNELTTEWHKKTNHLVCIQQKN